MAKIKKICVEREIETGLLYRLHSSNGFAGMPDEIIEINKITKEVKEEVVEHWSLEKDTEYWVRVEYQYTKEEYSEVMKWYPLEILIDHITIV